MFGVTYVWSSLTLEFPHLLEFPHFGLAPSFYRIQLCHLRGYLVEYMMKILCLEYSMFGVTSPICPEGGVVPRSLGKSLGWCSTKVIGKVIGVL